MYTIKINDKEFNLKLSLKALKRIQGKFKKPYMDVLQGFDKLSIEEQLTILSYCLIKDENNFSEEEFISYLEEYLPLGDMIKIFTILIGKSMQPKKSIEELEKDYENEIFRNFQKDFDEIEKKQGSPL